MWLAYLPYQAVPAQFCQDHALQHDVEAYLHGSLQTIHQKKLCLETQTTNHNWCLLSIFIAWQMRKRACIYARIWMWGTHYTPGRYALRLAPRVRSVETMSRRSPRVQARIRGVRPSLSTHCTQKKTTSQACFHGVSWSCILHSWHTVLCCFFLCEFYLGWGWWGGEYCVWRLWRLKSGVHQTTTHF